MPRSHRHTTGFRREATNLAIDYEGTEVVNIDATGLTYTVTRSAYYDLMPFLLGADGAALAAAETAGDFFRPVGTNQLWIQGEAAISETEASIGYCNFILPHDYKAGGTVTLAVTADLVGAGTNMASSIDFSAYLQSAVDGAVGSDLVTTAAQATTTTGAEYLFVVTPTGLVAGSTLVVKLTSSCIESAGMALATVIYRLGAYIEVNR